MNSFLNRGWGWPGSYSVFKLAVKLHTFSLHPFYGCQRSSHWPGCFQWRTRLHSAFASLPILSYLSLIFVSSSHAIAFTIEGGIFSKSYFLPPSSNDVQSCSFSFTLKYFITFLNLSSSACVFTIVLKSWLQLIAWTTLSEYLINEPYFTTCALAATISSIMISSLWLDYCTRTVWTIVGSSYEFFLITAVNATLTLPVVETLGS